MSSLYVSASQRSVKSDRLLGHCGGVAGPASVQDLNRKGTVENAIQHTRSAGLKGRRFETIDEQNVFLDQWQTKQAASRIHGRAKRQVEAMFQEERAHLAALPLQGFSYDTECERTVAGDTCVRIDHISYVARCAKSGRRVLVCLFERHVEIRDRLTQALLRTPRQRAAARRGECQRRH